MEFNLDEILKPDDVDLSSFKLKDSLSPKIWVKNENGKIVLDPKVRKQLLLIADDFFESLELDVDIEDVILTGSLANFNWSEYSDIDLHIVLDFGEIDPNEALVKEYFDAKKSAWNDSHDIKIYGFDVEIYLQDTKEKHTSTGIYSILHNKWNKKPSRENEKLTHIDYIKRKASFFMNIIDKLESLYDEGQYSYLMRKIDKIKTKIKSVRQKGLDRSGELSPENIVFKVLRRTGYIEKLFDLQLKSYDRSFSL
jgi:hypothetical protein